MCSSKAPCECCNCRQVCCVEIISCWHREQAAGALAGTLELQREWPLSAQTGKAASSLELTNCMQL